MRFLKFFCKFLFVGVQAKACALFKVLIRYLVSTAEPLFLFFLFPTASDNIIPVLCKSKKPFSFAYSNAVLNSLLAVSNAKFSFTSSSCSDISCKDNLLYSDKAIIGSNKSDPNANPIFSANLRLPGFVSSFCNIF